MEIKIDYYIGDPGNIRIFHHTITEDDILATLETQFREGEICCPINHDRETVKVEFQIDKVII